MRITPRDLYLLRKTGLQMRRDVLRAQQAERRYQELLLHLERKYGLLDAGTGGVIDPQTGEVRVEGIGVKGHEPQ